MAKMVCFIHKMKLFRTQTRYGGLWICPAQGCDVKCWEGKTSHPGTAEDFRERTTTHRLLDALWKDENGPFAAAVRNSKGHRRGKAYKWLAKFLGVEGEHAHIGMLRAAKCREVQAALQDLLDSQKSASSPPSHQDANP